MAEPFGIVAGSLAIAAMFNNCVDCFEYIKLGQNFGRDFETCQIRLDLARLQLTRWGEAVNINSNPRFMQLNTANPSDELAQAALWQILVLLAESSKISKAYNTTNTAATTSAANAATVPATVHKKLYSKVKLRQKTTGVFKKIAWALHQSGELHKLIDDISKLTCDLEKLYPDPDTNDALQRLAVYEIDDLDEPEIQVVSRNMTGADAVLAAAVQNKESALSMNTTGKITLSNEAKTLVGDDYSDAAVSSNFVPPQGSRNTTGDANLSGKAKLQVGSRYGGKSFMDD